eukprot:121872-Prymnesium_polylepis.1
MTTQDASQHSDNAKDLTLCVRHRPQKARSARYRPRAHHRPQATQTATYGRIRGPSAWNLSHLGTLSIPPATAAQSSE